MLNEVKRLQQLAGILKENHDERYNDPDMYDGPDDDFDFNAPTWADVPGFKDKFNLDNLDEMARTAGTGGALKLTDAGRAAYKETVASMKAGKGPGNMKEMWFRILRWMHQNEGKRLQKVDFAREVLGPNVPQPRVNPFFNQLIEKKWIDVDAYDAYSGEKKPAQSSRIDWGAKYDIDDL